MRNNCFWLTWKMRVYLMISVWSVSWVLVGGKDFNVVIFSDTICTINFKLCTVVVLSELYPFITFQRHWLYFKVTVMFNSFNWKFHVLIWSNWNIVWLLVFYLIFYFINTCFWFFCRLQCFGSSTCWPHLMWTLFLKKK